MIKDYAQGNLVRSDNGMVHSGRVMQSFSSRNLCIRARTPMGVPYGPTSGPTAEQHARDEEIRLSVESTRLEVQLRDALVARTTAQYGPHRVFKAAFAKFDSDHNGAVDFPEFRQALEHLGLHTADVGLPGPGGVAEDVMWALFCRYDADGVQRFLYRCTPRTLHADNGAIEVE